MLPILKVCEGVAQDEGYHSPMHFMNSREEKVFVSLLLGRGGRSCATPERLKEKAVVVPLLLQEMLPSEGNRSATVPLTKSRKKKEMNKCGPFIMRTVVVYLFVLLVATTAAVVSHGCHLGTRYECCMRL